MDADEINQLRESAVCIILICLTKPNNMLSQAIHLKVGADGVYQNEGWQKIEYSVRAADMAIGACQLITKLKWEDPGALEICLSFYE